MVLTRESRRAWWGIMAAAWLVSAALILLHTAGVRDYIAVLDGLAVPPETGPRTPLKQVLPANYADTQMWIHHAVSAREQAHVRVRHTTADNAPGGREVHWSSAMTWLLRAGSHVHEALTGRGGTSAVERTALWLNAPLLFLVLVVLSSWAGRLAGAGAGVLVAFALLGHRRLYEGFMPAYVDHHGLVAAAVLTLVLGIAFAGGGWWRPVDDGRRAMLPSSSARARRAALISGVAGATGLWLSAAAVIPVIALVGIVGFAAVAAMGRDAVATGARFDPGVWRRWGRAGAVGSVVFYLLEYAPTNLGLRLEVNHPLHAAAWWGGAELVAVLGEWRLAAGRSPGRPLLQRMALPLLGVVAAPLAIAAGGTHVFLVSDPFVGELRHFVAEGKTLAATIAQQGIGRVGADLAWAAILLPAGFVGWRRRDDARLVVGLLTFVTLALVIMSALEVRWWATVAAAQIPLLIALLAAGTSANSRARSMALVVALLVLAGTAVQRVLITRAENRRQAVTAADLRGPLYRDIAARLRDSQPEGDITLLADPNASAGIGYYGRFRTLGTLYWENAPGLRAAAEIFSAYTDDDALARIRARGVTHVALLAKNNFLGEYFQLLRPDARVADAQRTFGYRLLAKESWPAWLQPLPYRIPDELKPAETTVLLFKVAVGQPEAERLYHTIIAHAAAGDRARADAAFQAILTATPTTQRGAVATEIGMGLYDFGADAAAAHALRSALDAAYDPAAANTLAWILATSNDAALRNGRLALSLVEPLLREAPDDPTVLSTFAAACAEVGRGADAVRAAERALAAVRAARDTAAESLLARRLDTYRAGRPWRQ